MKTGRNIKKSSCLIALALLLAVGLTGGTLAYLKAKAAPVVNTFEPVTVENHIDEKFDGQTKTDVKIRNKGNIESYVRADILITWKDKNGNVLADAPVKDTDYKISQSLDGWKKINGQYYYTEKVAPEASTSNLIDSCTQIKKAPVDGYTLSVEILAETIQAEPDTAIKEAWGIDPVKWQEVK